MTKSVTKSGMGQLRKRYLNFEHYTIKNKPRLIGEIYTIKISNTRIIEIPVNRIKKITLNIMDIDEKVSDTFDKK